MNKMKQIQIEKITLNIGTGEPGDRLEKAKLLLNHITNAKSVQTTTQKRIPTWGVRPGLQLGCKVTLRGQKAIGVLKRLLKAVDNQLTQRKFDDTGNFSFGIAEYLDIPDTKYDASIGIIGLETAVTLERPGYRIKRRRIKKRKIGTKHAITKEEAIEYIKNEFKVEIK
tara:strand:- start:9022 stop:9528 length:507 start_codon:yes stop_codon:yes gene_type:complete